MSPNSRTIFDKFEFEDRSKFAAEFPGFERYRNLIIGALRKAAGNNSFDETGAWGALRRAAHWYFRRTKTKPHVLRPARRVERLRKLAKMLHQTHRLVYDAMHDNVGFDLMRGWCTENDVSLKAAVTFKNGRTVIPFAEKLEQLVAELSALEAAANVAADNICAQAGAPGGDGILTGGDLSALRAIYRRATGKQPILGPGPFAEFVELFLIAIGRSADIQHDYVVEFFKYLKRKAAQENRSKLAH